VKFFSVGAFRTVPFDLLCDLVRPTPPNAQLTLGIASLFGFCWDESCEAFSPVLVSSSMGYTGGNSNPPTLVIFSRVGVSA